MSRADQRVRVVLREPHPRNLFADAYLFEGARDWLDRAVDPDGTEVVASAWGQMDDGGTLHLSQVVAHRRGRGFGRECLMVLLKTARRRGATQAEAYVEHANAPSQRMMRVLGFTEARRESAGSYWTMELRANERRQRRR